MRVGIDQHSGFCGGVIRAITTAEDFLSKGNGRLWSLGAIVHNEEELARLGRQGLRTIDHDGLSALGDGDTVLIRAHGEPPQTYERLRQAGLDSIDCTCPVVLKLQKQIKEAAARAQVVIFGKIGHPEVLGLVGQTDGRALVVETPEQLRAALADGVLRADRPVELFSQTTMSPEGYEALTEELRSLMTGPLEVHSTICAQVASRHRELAEFARTHDVIVFVSGVSSSNGKVLFEWCRNINPRSWHISAPGDLKAEWFAGAASAGVCGATSTPKWLLEEVAAAIKDLQ
ncbi:MAG: 4-hydroxy-3-methylbut-2-enyl diphosphate reductase [Bacteroidales bacterium]|nr:4-hydroxy-3-methylbut-2-enyl diphosphate reductase [Bacteroidales bacterium]